MEKESVRTRYALFREADKDLTSPLHGKTYDCALDATLEALDIEFKNGLTEKLQVVPVKGDV